MTIAVPLAPVLARGSRLDPLPQPRDRARRRSLACDRVLDVQGRTPSYRGSVARRTGDAARALPAVPRADHLHVLPAARVHPGRARARARDQGDGGASRADRPTVPVCRAKVESFLPRLPGVHDAPPSGVPVVRAAARVALAGLPVLRDGDPRDASGARRRDEPVAARDRLDCRGRMARETTLVLVKPDGMRRGLAGRSSLASSAVGSSSAVRDS